MDSHDFTKLKRQEPFRPFRVKTADRRNVDVLFPELLKVRDTYVWIGIPRKGSNKPIFEHFEWVNYEEITGYEVLEANKAS
jgi:hypothetical protein